MAGPIKARHRLASNSIGVLPDHAGGHPELESNQKFGWQRITVSPESIDDGPQCVRPIR
jgi:hypothetical protein